MMNLEVLLVSAALTGNTTLRDIAVAHATTTMKNHIRNDGSTWHVRTAQGYSDSSTWTRGQAWGVYGFANMYNWTRNTEFLDTSRRLATDFNAPVSQRPADSSAATIVASGLLYLAQLEESGSSNAQKWQTAAIQILNHITALAWNEPWQSLLSNGTVNKSSNNCLTGTTYGDYYYV
ncbi:Six-hairpin glycosidase-like protein [Mucidula mucida]|nr:Six-hairpin glycosidase-like protein [Mucidula mucida]